MDNLTYILYGVYVHFRFELFEIFIVKRKIFFLILLQSLIIFV